MTSRCCLSSSLLSLCGLLETPRIQTNSWICEVGLGDISTSIPFGLFRWNVIRLAANKLFLADWKYTRETLAAMLAVVAQPPEEHISVKSGITRVRVSVCLWACAWESRWRICECLTVWAGRTPAGAHNTPAELRVEPWWPVTINVQTKPSNHSTQCPLLNNSLLRVLNSYFLKHGHAHIKGGHFVPVMWQDKLERSLPIMPLSSFIFRQLWDSQGKLECWNLDLAAGKHVNGSLTNTHTAQAILFQATK